MINDLLRITDNKKKESFEVTGPKKPPQYILLLKTISFFRYPNGWWTITLQAVWIATDGNMLQIFLRLIMARKYSQIAFVAEDGTGRRKLLQKVHGFAQGALL